MRNKILLSVSAAIAVGCMIVFAFAYGVLAEHYNLFPRPQLYALWKSPLALFAPKQDSDLRRIPLIFTDIELTKHRVPDVEPWGGAIDVVGNQILGTDLRGKFFSVRGDESKSRDVKILDIEIDTGYQRFLDHVNNLGVDVNKLWFRVHDILIDEEGGRLFVSHHFWDSARACSTVRFAWVKISSTDFATLNIKSTDWNLLYETDPCIGLQIVGNPFEGLQSGARMSLRNSRELIITVGDHGLDGWGSTPNLPQDSTSSYGKLWSIDLQRGDARIISIGHRNPEGLVIDRDGRMWTTEHGPRGGDELNLIEEGSNYGWPLVTYGTQYGYQRWPDSSDAEQNRHSGYEKPVFVWVTSIGVGQVMQISGFTDAWDRDLLVAGMMSRTLYRIRYEDDRVVFSESLPVDLRVRDMAQLADGTLVLWTDSAEIAYLKPIKGQELSVDFMATLDSADRSRLLDTLEVCHQCHTFTEDSDSRQKSPLWQVFDRDIASTDYPFYSEALRQRSGDWDSDNLNDFLSSPNEFAPGTTMAFTGISDEKLRAQVIAYLKSLQ